jgi:AAA+ superfamily predicted ATPase
MQQLYSEEVKMYKMVVFRSMDHIDNRRNEQGDISTKVNDWLETMDAIEITNVLQTQSETNCPSVVNHTITIFHPDLKRLGGFLLSNFYFFNSPTLTFGARMSLS